MKNRKKLVSILAGVMAAVLVLTLILSLLPTRAYAASSSEIRKQITGLQEQRTEMKSKMKELESQYQENKDEISNIVAKKNLIDQEMTLLHAQVDNINEQITAYGVLVADKQDELDAAQENYNTLNEEYKTRIRTMEEEGTLSYWEVLFKANSFSDLLDRMSMIEEIAASDTRRLEALDEATKAVAQAQQELETEKAELESTKEELDATQAVQRNFVIFFLFRTNGHKYLVFNASCCKGGQCPTLVCVKASDCFYESDSPDGYKIIRITAACRVLFCDMCNESKIMFNELVTCVIIARCKFF